MEVVVLNDYEEANGGSSVVALTSAAGLARSGVATTLFSAVAGKNGQGASLLDDVPNLTTINLGQEEIVKDSNRLRAFRRGVANREAAEELRKLLLIKDPHNTVVHVHTYTKALSPLVMDVALRLGFKTILSLHDFFISCPTGGFFVFEKGEICHRRPLSLSCLSCSCDRRSVTHKIWRSARTFYQNQILGIDRRLSLYIGISDLSVKVLRPWLPAHVPVKMVRNPVDFSREAPAPVEENAPFLFIGRFSKEKGPLLFAEAVKKTGAPAVFIGDGELMEEAKKICPNATFTGWLPPAEVHGWLRKARALVFPPLWYETLGLVVLEAMANGVPAIISDQCAATDFVVDASTGMYFQHGSVDALIEKLTILQTPGIAGRLGAAAHAWYWNDPWTLGRHVAELTQVYEDLLAGGGKS